MKQITALIVALGILLGVCFVSVEISGADTSTGLISKKFDLGGNGAASGYIGVSATDKYDSKKGYGIGDTNLARNVTAPGSGAYSDAIHFQGGYGSLLVDLPVGVYKITVTTGNIQKATICAEGVNQLFFMEGFRAVDSFTIPVTDGQLNIYASSGVGTEFSLCTVEIEQVSSGTTTKPTIWLCGDSTVCKYYNFDDSQNPKRGWGEFLHKYVDTDRYDIRNVSVNGARTQNMVDTYFKAVEKYGKKDDILVLALGINDYGDELKKHPDAIDSTTYVRNMTTMIRAAKERGMTVYVVKQHGDLSDAGYYPLREKKYFSDELDAISASEKVGVIDMYRPWLEILLGRTQTIAQQYYCAEKGVHPNATGADMLAQIAADQMFPKEKEWPVHSDPYPEFDATADVIYQTEVSGQPITNPHKGFVNTCQNPLMLYSGQHPWGIGGSNQNTAWDVVTIVSDVLFWKDLNPEKGVYDFSRIDAMLKACEQAGMTYGMRIIPWTSSNTDDQSNYGAKHDFVPQWVYAEGAQRDLCKYTHKGVTYDIYVPHWSDPTYIQYYKEFLAELAKRYNGDPRVEYMEVRAFGNMGEWHTSEFEGNELPDLETQKDMFRFIAQKFDKTTCSVFADARELYDFTNELGFAKRNNGLISTRNTEWDLVPAYRANVMTMADNHDPYSIMKKPTEGRIVWSADRFLEGIEIAHLSIYALDQESKGSYDFYNEQKSLVDATVNRLGYNYTVTSAKRKDNKLKVEIRNTGVAPAFFDIYLCAEITDANGKKIANFGEPALIPKGSFHDGDERAYLFEYKGTLPANATVCLAMYESKKYKSVSALLGSNDDPTVRFDNKNDLANKRLKLVEDQSVVSVRIHANGSDRPVATVGDIVALKAEAAGAGTLHYQWQSRKDPTCSWTNSGQNGAKTDTLSVKTIAGLHGWQFRCIVTDAKGKKAYSNAIAISVVPKITTEPKNQTVSAGSVAKFTIAASGAGTLTYQWQSRKDATCAWTNSAQSGAKTSTLSVAALAGLHGWQFRCVVTDGAGQKSYSAAVTLSIVPKITSQPKNVSVTVGTTAKFTVTATGRGNLVYRWQSRKDATCAWTNSAQSGAKTNTLSVNVLKGLNGWQFRCVVTDANGQMTYSDVVTLSVK